MDDLHISYRHSICRIVERNLQDSIYVVEKFAQKNCFKFSTSKTSMLHFNKLSSPSLIEVQLGNIRFEKSETVKYLGLVFDSELDWKAHVQYSNESPKVKKPQTL